MDIHWQSTHIAPTISHFAAMSARHRWCQIFSSLELGCLYTELDNPMGKFSVLHSCDAHYDNHNVHGWLEALDHLHAHSDMPLYNGYVEDVYHSHRRCRAQCEGIRTLAHPCTLWYPIARVQNAKHWHKRCRTQCKGIRALRKRKFGTSGVGLTSLHKKI